MWYDLQELEATISEEEIKSDVMTIAPEKAPETDGYIGAFFSRHVGISLNTT
jgi:hypothetical protein